MIFFFPVRSDAPVYYFPYATIGLIVVNVMTFALTGGGYTDAAIPWMLEYGHFNPIEWVSVHFVHLGIMHLVGNMIFLWCFGLIVEGKIGWWRMLAFYFGIAITGAAFIQIVMLGYTGDVPGAAGASLAVFGMMAVALAWAPKNNVDVFYFVFIFFILRVGFFEVSVLSVALFYLVTNFLYALFSTEVAVTGEVAHLIGAGIGFGLGLLLLKLKKVDCEGWDFFSVMSGDTNKRQQNGSYLYGANAFEIEQSRHGVSSNNNSDDDNNEAFVVRQEKRRRRALKKINSYLSSQNPHAAFQEFELAQSQFHNFKLSQKELMTLIDALYKQSDWENAASLMQTSIQQYPDTNARIRLQLAALMVEIKERPRFALETLKPIDTKQLSEKHQRYLLKIKKKAEQMIDDGVMELDGKTW